MTSKNILNHKQRGNGTIQRHLGGWSKLVKAMHSELILGLRPANERRRYFVATSLIGWTQACNQPCNAFIQDTDVMGQWRLMVKNSDRSTVFTGDRSACWCRNQNILGETRSFAPCFARSAEALMKHINLLGPGKCDNNFQSIVSEYMLQIKFANTSCEIAPMCTCDVKSTLNKW